MANQTAPTGRDSHQQAYLALERLLQRVAEHKITGQAHLTLSLNQGGVTNAEAEITTAVK